MRNQRLKAIHPIDKLLEVLVVELLKPGYYDQTAFFLEEKTFLFFIGYVVKNGLSTTPQSFSISFVRVGSLRPLLATFMSV